MSYDYKSPKLQKKRLEILDRDEWKCCACYDAGSTLAVHHGAYQGQPWEVDSALLQTLCESCHTALGPHPKGGVWWTRVDRQPRVLLFWCPLCKCRQFAMKGSLSFVCHGCAWNPSIYSQWGYDFGSTIELIELPDKAKPKTYSLKWLTGMMSKVRKGGASDFEFFQSVFPDYPVDSHVRMFTSLVARLRERSAAGEMSPRDELALCAHLIQARDAIETVLLVGEKEAGTLAKASESFAGVEQELEVSVDPAFAWRRSAEAVGGLTVDFAELASHVVWRDHTLEVSFSKTHC